MWEFQVCCRGLAISADDNDDDASVAFWNELHPTKWMHLTWSKVMLIAWLTDVNTMAKQLGNWHNFPSKKYLGYKQGQNIKTVFAMETINILFFPTIYVNSRSSWIALCDVVTEVLQYFFSRMGNMKSKFSKSEKIAISWTEHEEYGIHYCTGQLWHSSNQKAEEMVNLENIFHFI